MARFTDDHFDELINQVLAHNTILIALCWHLDRSGHIDGKAFRETLEGAAQMTASSSPKTSRNIREFADLYPIALSVGPDQKRPSWFMGIIPGGKADDQSTDGQPE